MSGTYFNEFDPFAAAWLRELIAAGHLPAGTVDEKDIREVRADDVEGHAECHFFAGIGGWPLALRLAGWDATRPVWTGSCPCPPFSSAGKKKCKECGGKVGFVGDEFGCLSCPWRDERHLWPDFRRLIAICRPPVVFGEQVASADGREWLSRVRLDLEALGYVVGAADLCAAGQGAPHIRQRLFWVADCHGERREGGEVPAGQRQRIPDAAGGCGAGRLGHPQGHRRDQQLRVGGVAEGEGQFVGGELADDGHVGGMGDADSQGREGQRLPGREREGGGDAGQAGGEARFAACGGGFWDAHDIIPCRDGKARRVEPGTFPLAHGVPARVGRLRGYGNAISPQVAAAFIVAYLKAKTQMTSFTQETH